MTTDDDKSDWARIVIKSPLPMSVAGTLMTLIGSAWPGSVIDTNADSKFSKYDRDGLVMLVDHRKAPKKVGKRAAAALAAANTPAPDDEDPNFLGFSEDDGHLVMHTETPESLQKMFGAIAHELLSVHHPPEQAPNYLEWELTLPAEDARYVCSVARTKATTPHALRVRAETDLAALRASLRALADRADACHTHNDLAELKFHLIDLGDAQPTPTGD